MKERQKERQTERQTDRERETPTRNRRGVAVVTTKVTAATEPKPGVKSARPAIKEKRGNKCVREREEIESMCAGL